MKIGDGNPKFEIMEFLRLTFYSMQLSSLVVASPTSVSSRFVLWLHSMISNFLTQKEQDDDDDFSGVSQGM
jgi:hypothetical protein